MFLNKELAEDFVYIVIESSVQTVFNIKTDISRLCLC